MLIAGWNVSDFCGRVAGQVCSHRRLLLGGLSIGCIVVSRVGLGVYIFILLRYTAQQGQDMAVVLSIYFLAAFIGGVAVVQVQVQVMMYYCAFALR
jgi:hypothetical protein